MADDDSCVRSKRPLLQFGTCKLKGLRKRDGLPLCQGERPEADSFLRVERRDKAGLLDSLTEEGRRKTIPFHAKRGKSSLQFRVRSTLRTGKCQQWLLHHPRGGNILVESVGETVLTLSFGRPKNRTLMVTMTRMSGRCWASIPASPSMRVCTLRTQLEEHMVGMSKLEKGRVQYITTAGKLLCLRGSASMASLLKQQDEP